MEIERRFLIDGFPKKLTLIDRAEVFQAYLSTNPVVRIRKALRPGQTTEYYLTIKGSGKLKREEVEWRIEKGEFTRLGGIVGPNRIKKDYRVFSLGKYRLECSRVEAANTNSFYYAEVEFGSVEEAEKFNPPDFLKEEITQKEGFTMADIWRRSLGTG